MARIVNFVARMILKASFTKMRKTNNQPLEIANESHGHRLLEKLPLGQAGLMEFQLSPLGPISALGSLIRPPAN
jgi:hypothetical protein